MIALKLKGENSQLSLPLLEFSPLSFLGHLHSPSLTLGYRLQAVRKGRDPTSHCLKVEPSSEIEVRVPLPFHSL